MESLKLQKHFPDETYGGTEARKAADSIESNDDDVTLDELIALMKTPSQQMSAAINLSFGNLDGLCNRLRTSPEIGLKSEDLDDLERRREKFGSNSLPPRKRKLFICFMWEAIQDTTLIILIIAAIISLGLSFYTPPPNSSSGASDPTDDNAGFIEGIGIIVAVVIIVLVTAGINYSKEAQFQGLQKRLADQHHCSVIRSKTVSEISTLELVVGDICVFEYGDAIPADGIVIRGVDLRLDESSHTGESMDVPKDDISNPVLYAGTYVLEGSGKMLVTGVGINSAKGVLFSLMGATDSEEESEDESNEKKSPLHKKLSSLALQIAYAGTTLALLTFIILVIRFCVETFLIQNNPWNNIYIEDFVSFIIISITILVVAVPEGLPLAVILALAYSIKEMVNDKNLVRHLDACEVMGHATTILCDKTGTLTTNRMTVVRSYIAGFTHEFNESLKHLPEDIRRLLSSSIAFNTSYKTQLKGSGNSSVQIGNRTECALLGLVGELGFDYRYLREKVPERDFAKVFPFNSTKKWMATVVPREHASGHYVFVKGAWEVILEKCLWILSSNFEPVELTEERRKILREEVIEPSLATSGLRVIVLAYKIVDSADSDDAEAKAKLEANWNDEKFVFSELICLAVVGISDPVRPEVPEAIRRCQRAGITVRMVTGDHVDTARWVAIKCGIFSPGEDQLCVDGSEFNRLIRKPTEETPDQDMFDLLWPRLRILARSSPMDKYNLVKGIMSSSLGANRQIVAVTGDGTNDGPALKKAHVGLAMGITGTDVARESSDIILLDDNFSSIVKAVVWGRHVYDSIAKFVQFQLTVNIVAVILALIGACVVMDSPLKGVQMLWVNLLMDSLASLSLATEAPTEEVLKRKPYGSKQHLVSCLMATNIIAHSAYELTALLIILFAGADLMDVDDGRDPSLRGVPNSHYTFLFNTFVMMILFNEINARKIDGNPNVFGGLWRSPIFILIWLASFATQVIIVEVGGTVFLTVKLTWDQWLWSIFIGIGDLIYGQIVTFFVNLYLSSFGRHRNYFGDESDRSSSSSGPDSEITEFEMTYTADSAPLWARIG